MVNSLKTLGLAPVLLVQGLYARWKTDRLPEAEGARTGVYQGASARRVSLLLAGDSSAAGVGVAHQDQALIGQMCQSWPRDVALRWQLTASSGAKTADLIADLEGQSGQFDVAVIAIGVNDVTGRVGLNDWLQQQQALVETLRLRFGVAQVIFSGLPPVSEFPALPTQLRRFLGERARQFDTARQEWTLSQAAVTGVPLALDVTDKTLIAADGFHPGPKAYALWGWEMAKVVVQVCEQEGLFTKNDKQMP